MESVTRLARGGMEPARREGLNLNDRVSWLLGTKRSLVCGGQELERGGGESLDSASRGERRGQREPSVCSEIGAQRED